METKERISSKEFLTSVGDDERVNGSAQGWIERRRGKVEEDANRQEERKELSEETICDGMGYKMDRWGRASFGKEMRERN